MAVIVLTAACEVSIQRDSGEPVWIEVVLATADQLFVRHTLLVLCPGVWFG